MITLHYKIRSIALRDLERRHIKCQGRVRRGIHQGTFGDIKKSIIYLNQNEKFPISQVSQSPTITSWKCVFSRDGAKWPFFKFNWKMQKCSEEFSVDSRFSPNSILNTFSGNASSKCELKPTFHQGTQFTTQNPSFKNITFIPS